MEIFNNIRAWAYNRGLYKEGDVKTQYVKLNEEVGELANAILKNNEEELIDAIGDIVVVLTNLTYLANQNIVKSKHIKIEDCINSAYEQIKDRKGKMVDGDFQKER